MKTIKLIRKLLNPLKMDLKIYPNEDLRRRKKLLNYYKINKILDVGANSGQYAKQILELGFKCKIISFEPVKSTYKLLEKEALNYKTWEAYNFGFGDKDEEIEINISENTFSSSILNITPIHVKSAPESKVTNKELITIKKLDTVYDEFFNKNDIVLLKIDVQGFEKNVLEGGLKSLHKIKGIQIEMSIQELYQNEILFSEMLTYLESLGFKLHSLENGFFDNNSGKLLQVDGIFFKE